MKNMYIIILKQNLEKFGIYRALFNLTSFIWGETDLKKSDLAINYVM